MKTVSTFLTALMLLAVCGCASPRGGGVAADEGFRIATPFFATDITQGDRQTVTVTVKRDENFKEDVRLEATTSRGISVDPSVIVVRASDSPDVQFRIAAPLDAALGEYRVRITGTPETGQPTSTEIKVKVAAP